MLSKVFFSLVVLVSSSMSFAAPAKDLLPNSGGLQKVHGRDGRQIVADSKDLTVYTFAPDKNDVSVCYDKCAKEWPPVLVKAGTLVKAPFGTTVRKDKTVQVTYKHRPIYNYDDDKISGDMFGEGKHGVWFVIEMK